MIRIEHNVETNEIIEIELTAAEIKEKQAEQVELDKRLAKLNLEQNAKATEKAALLERLGITEDEAKLLLA
jgi:hypothetical protein